MSMHREDWERKFADGKQWAAGHRQLVLLAAVFVIAFTLGAVSCRAATINIPACDTLTVLGQTPAVVTLACGHAPAPPTPAPPPAPVAGAGCGEFTQKVVSMEWPTAANNIRNASGLGWTGDVAMVIRFKAGTVVGDTASFQFAHTGPPYQNMVAAVSSAPGCNVVRTFVANSVASQTPIFRFIVGGTKPGHMTVQPGADYWITAVWRNGYGNEFVPSCAEGNCAAGVRFDFNT